MSYKAAVDLKKSPALLQNDELKKEAEKGSEQVTVMLGAGGTIMAIGLTGDDGATAMTLTYSDVGSKVNITKPTTGVIAAPQRVYDVLNQKE